MQSLSALLLSNDAAAVRITNNILSKYSFNVEEVTTTPMAEHLISCKAFDLAVYDQDTAGAIDLAKSQAAAGAPRVVFAMLGGTKIGDLHDRRVHFFVQKPFTADLFARSVKAACSVMLKEKRAAFRHSVRIKPFATTLIHSSERRALQNAVILNVSQTGLSLETGEMVPQGADVEVSFQLPGRNALVRLVGTIIWVHESGRTGVKFIDIPPNDREAFYAWLDSMLPWGNISSKNALTQE